VTPARLKDLYDRRVAALARRPAFARAVAHASVQLVDGHACAVEHDGRMVRVDLPPEEGGAGGAPQPAQLMRASLGASLVLGYRTWAARLGVPLDDAAVEVTCESDLRGSLGVDDAVAVGWQRVAIDVTITSAAPEGQVRRLVAHADRLCPMLANLSRDVQRVHQLTIVRPSTRAAGEP
jgi:uncharacterized OsmC-like protein